MILDRPSDRPTDIVTYRVACTRLKTVVGKIELKGKERVEWNGKGVGTGEDKNSYCEIELFSQH